MRALHLDYQRDYRPFPTLGVFLLVCASLAVFLTARQYLGFTERLARWEERADAVERIARKKELVLKTSPQNKEQTVREVNRANEILRRITLPWNELFGAVEAVMSKDVALLDMEPDADKQLLKIVGEAKDIPAMFDFIRSLEGKEMFRSVILQSHQVQLQDPQRPIRFSLLADWRDRS